MCYDKTIYTQCAIEHQEERGWDGDQERHPSGHNIRLKRAIVIGQRY